MTATIDAADIWHADDNIEGVLKRNNVREEWPELGVALDGMPPRDIREIAQDGVSSPVNDLNRALRAIPAREETVTVRIKPNWAALVTCVASLLVGMAVGMALQFAALSSLIGR